MSSTEMMEKELPGDLEIQLKLKERSTTELIRFQRKLKQQQYSTNPQAMTIRFHLVTELLERHLIGDGVFDPELRSAKDARRRASLHGLRRSRDKQAVRE